MIIIDGARGEGGGQILRSSLSLAVCLRQPIRIENIRANRQKPGLMRQHLACVRAASEISDAEVFGDEMGSSVVEFTPNSLNPGKYHFAVGTAGSTTLIFQTIFPALLCADGESEITFEGGTHNGMAPSIEFIQHSFKNAMKLLGIDFDLTLIRHGFYPNGAGSWRVLIKPVTEIQQMDLIERGEIIESTATAISAKIPEHVAERELDYMKRKCGWDDSQLESRYVDAHGPGNLFSLRVQSENVTEVFDAVGNIGVKAERVAGRAARDMKRYLAAEVPIGEYLCDQLLLLLALGNGGRFRTLRPSLHTLTNCEVIKQFMDINIEMTKINNDRYEVTINT